MHATISKAIQSRCAVLEFSPVRAEELRQVIVDALAKTGFSLDEARINSIVDRARGIPREAVKLLLETFALPPT